MDAPKTAARPSRHATECGGPLGPFTLPPWVEAIATEVPCRLSTDDRMQLAIGLAAASMRDDQGHPFGAAVFEVESGVLIAVGINRVVQHVCSAAHAEMVALAHAQQRYRSIDLRAPGIPPLELVASCEPCAMCFAAIMMSGVRRVVCGARAEDAEACGFSQGVKPSHWPTLLKDHGIDFIADVQRDEARALLRQWNEQRR